MMQKVTLALVSLVAVASLAACGLMWSLARDFQSASTEMLSQSREVNAELLSQLSAIANREPEGPSLMEWVPLKVQVVKNDEAKTPGEGFRVQIQGHAISDTETVYLHEETDESGTADFGIVRPGSYEVVTTTPWNKYESHQILVKPGSAHIEKIRAPDGPPESYQVKPVVPWPKELEGKDVAVLVQIERTDETQIGEQTWRPLDDKQYLLIRPSGQLAVYNAVIDEEAKFNSTLEGNYETVRFAGQPEAFENSFPWRGRDASIGNLRILHLAKDANFPEEGDSLKCLSTSEFLQNRGFSNNRTSQRRGASSQKLFTYRIQGEGIQEWPITIAPMDAYASRIMLTPIEFPNFPAEKVLIAALQFFLEDTDKNLEHSKEEVLVRSPPSVDPAEYPVSIQEYIKLRIQSRD